MRYAELMGESTGLPPLPVAEMGPPRLTPLARPVREARVFIVTSAGVHLDSDPPFNHPNDMTSRRIPHATPPERLRPSPPDPGAALLALEVPLPRRPATPQPRSTGADRDHILREQVVGHRTIAARVIGTLRRERPDHMLVLGEEHLASVLSEFVR